MIRQLSEPNYIQGDAGHDELVACNKWDYDTSQFQNTIIENWDLVCGNKIMSKISSFVFFAGTGVGVFLAGILADKIGRHRTICLFIVLFIISSLKAVILIVWFSICLSLFFGVDCCFFCFYACVLKFA